MQPINRALLISGALEAFKNRVNAQNRRRAFDELRPSDTHKSYPHSSKHQRERYLRQLAAGRVPADQIGQLVDGRVV